MFDIFKNLKEKCFIIAEIGSNHQGSVELAKQLISEAKKNGASAVKFQKRDNVNLFTKELYDQVYDNKNSFGETYGKHREALEFGEKEFQEIKKYCLEQNIIFFSTAFDKESVNFLDSIGVELFKIASADLINIPLIDYIASKNKTIVLSTGGGTIEDIKLAVNTILNYHEKLVILHCTASYPVVYKDMNLMVIKKLKEEFPNHVIGLSDHENGIHAASIAYMLGARVFEKHFTLNRSWKGTDHSFSLEPVGLNKLTRNLERIPYLLGDGIKRKMKSEEAPLKKMSKSIVAASNILKGEMITDKMIDFKSPGGGLSPANYKSILGKKAIKDIKKDQQINHLDLA